MRLEMKAKRRELLKAMRAMPDYSMNLSWRLGSAVPGLGMLLRRYAPADTYTLWKVRAWTVRWHDSGQRGVTALMAGQGWLAQQHERLFGAISPITDTPTLRVCMKLRAHRMHLHVCTCSGAVLQNRAPFPVAQHILITAPTPAQPPLVCIGWGSPAR